MARFWVSVLVSICAILVGCAGHSPVARQQELSVFTASFEGPGKMSLSDTSKDTPLLWLQIAAPIQALVWREHTITVCTDYTGNNLGDVLNDIKIISRNRNVVLAGPVDGIMARPRETTVCTNGLHEFELQLRDVFEVRRGEQAELSVIADFKPSSATTIQVILCGTGEGLDDNVSISYAIKGNTMSLVRSQ